VLDAPMLDPTGALIVEIRETPEVAALVKSRVRPDEPAGASDAYEGDALAAPNYKAFIVVTPLSIPPDPRLPISFAEWGFSCYGATFQNAWAVYAAVVKGIHGRGVRTKSSGLGFYNSFVATGGGEDTDPITKQPVVTGTIRAIVTTAPVVTA
jgi:hypothetical protein